MWALYAGLILLVLKWLAVEPVASWEWWWVLSPLLVAFLWFEYFERLFGRDKRSMEMAEWERLRRERVREDFDAARKNKVR